MKNTIKFLLQRILGFRNYLFVFSWYKVKTLRGDRKENDFFQFLELIPEGASVLDIGANIGIMTVHLSRRTGSGKVFAFEPMPDNLRALNRIIRHFGLENVRVFDCALGDRDGEVEMVMPVEGKARQQGLSHVVHETITERNEGIRLKTALRKLDNIKELRDPSANIKGIKMDVENFESFVLEGGKELLQQWWPVIYTELWDNENRYKCFDLLKELSYVIKVAGTSGLEDYDPARHTNQNFIFIKG
ncbi:MAG: FkbM family methyltransferase [Bacteroidetes bacterium]|nr:MAG: FkbM family methyltransferase [Bacteroidota bacterium]